jgi:hypothetical protein
MAKSKTHFEQVPVEFAKKVAKLHLAEAEPVAPRRRDNPKAQYEIMPNRDVKRTQSLEQSLETLP